MYIHSRLGTIQVLRVLKRHFVMTSPLPRVYPRVQRTVCPTLVRTHSLTSRKQGVTSRIKEITVPKFGTYKYIHFYLKHPSNPKYIERFKFSIHSTLIERLVLVQSQNFKKTRLYQHVPVPHLAHIPCKENKWRGIS